MAWAPLPVPVDARGGPESRNERGHGTQDYALTLKRHKKVRTYFSALSYGPPESERLETASISVLFRGCRLAQSSKNIGTISKFAGSILLCLTVAWLCTGKLPCLARTESQACANSNMTMQQAIDITLRRQANHDWQKVHWQTNAAAALMQAQRENKPIFIFFVVTQRAKLPEKLSGDT
jgi:hypothetical protein